MRHLLSHLVLYLLTALQMLIITKIFDNLNTFGTPRGADKRKTFHRQLKKIFKFLENL